MKNSVYRISKRRFDEVCICAFRVLDGETFFKKGKIQLVQDKNILDMVKEIVEKYIFYYDNYPTNFFCSSGVFFVCVDLRDGVSCYDALLFLARVVYQVQKYLLKNMHLLASGCITKGKHHLQDKTKICLESAKIVFDVKTCSIMVQPYIVVDDLFTNETKRLAETSHLFEAEEGFYIINYFRFLQDIQSMQFAVDYMCESQNEKSKQVLLFKDMFNAADEKFKQRFENNCLI